MSPQLRDFVFSVDTDEVLETVTPPAPVVASPRRRAPAPPSVALRLPDLRAVALAEPSSTVSPASMSFETATPRMTSPDSAAPASPMPVVTLPMLPKAETSDPVTSLDDKARASVAQSFPVAPAAEPPATYVAVTVVTPDPEAFWKNPKFMLAGVAAAFLGMVSLMAMNHEPTPVGDDAAAWSESSVAVPGQPTDLESQSQITPLVIRGDDPSSGAMEYRSRAFADDESPIERTASAPRREDRYSEQREAQTPVSVANQGPWVDNATGTERISFADDTEGTARLVKPLPNLAPPVTREASQESFQPDGTNRY